MQQTLHEIAAVIAAATSLALVLRGWHLRRRYRRALAAQRMRKYPQRRARARAGHEQLSLEAGRVGFESGPPEELKNGQKT